MENPGKHEGSSFEIEQEQSDCACDHSPCSCDTPEPTQQPDSEKEHSEHSNGPSTDTTALHAIEDADQHAIPTFPPTLHRKGTAPLHRESSSGSVLGQGGIMAGWVKSTAKHVVSGFRAHKKKKSQISLKRFMQTAVGATDQVVRVSADAGFVNAGETWRSMDSTASSMSFSKNRRSSQASDEGNDCELLKQFLHAKRRRSQCSVDETSLQSTFRSQGAQHQPWVNGMYFRACMRPPGLQDKRLEELRHKATWFRPILQANNPFARSVFRVILVIFALGVAVYSSLATVTLKRREAWKIRAAQFRFTPSLPAHNDTHSFELPSAAKLDLLWKGCKVASASDEQHGADGSRTLVFGSQQDVSGWCAEWQGRSPAVPPALSKVSFKLAVRDRDSDAWQDIGAEGVGEGKFAHVSQVDREAMESGGWGCHELHVGLEFMLGEIFLPWLWVVLMLLAVALACRGAEAPANSALIFGVLLSAVLNVVIAVLASVNGRTEAMLTWVRVGILLFAIVLLRRPRQNLHLWLAGAAVVHSVAFVVERTVLLDAGDSLAKAGDLYMAAVLTCGACGVALKRHLDFVTALHLLQERDEALYDAAWERVLENQRGWMLRLQGIASKCFAYGDLSVIAPPEQRRVMLDHAGRGGDDAVSVHSTMRPGWLPVTSLDQLHVQAALVLPVLRERVQRWGVESNGWLRLKPHAIDEEARCVFALWEDVAMGRRTVDDVQWTPPKSLSRAMQKAVEVLGCDVSRLCDMARESIWFETIDDLARCLDAIDADPLCFVEGAKNALSPARTAGTGGFRFVKVLVRLMRPYSSELGLEGHVCEVLLLLKELESVRTFEMHERYLAFRAARARDSRLLSPTWGADLVQGAWRRASVALRRGTMHSLARNTSRRSSVSSTSRFNVGGEAAARPMQQRQQAQEPQRAQRNGREGGGEGDREVEEDGEGEEVDEGRALEAEGEQCVRRLVAELNVGEPGEVGKRQQNLMEAVARASSGSVFRMHRPISALLCKRRYQAMAFLAGTALLLTSSGQLNRSLNTQLSARVFRFTNLETRSGGMPSSPGIESFGLLHDGCALEPRQTVVNGSAILVEFEHSVSYSDWVITTSLSGPPAADAARFSLEATDASSAEDQPAWELVGSSSWFRILYWPTKFEPDKRRELPVERGAEVSFRLQYGAAEYLQPSGGLIVALVMLVSSMCGVLHRQLLAVKIIKGLLVLAQVPPIVTCALLVPAGQEREGWYILSAAVGGSLWVLLVTIREGWFPEAFLVTGAISIVSTAVVQTLVYKPESWLGAIDVFGVIYMLLGGVCRAYSLFNDWHVTQVYHNDCEMYSGIWRRVQREDEEERVLDRLHEVTAQLRSSNEARQRCLPWHPELDDDTGAVDPAWWEACALFRSKECFGVCPPVSSIDQLYAQAPLAALVLRYKVLAWGRASGGMGLLAEPNRGGGPRVLAQFIKLADVRKGEEHLVHWGKVKAPLRALEKAHRCYGGDVSKLCDLARHSLVFDRPTELLGCVERMAADDEVQILRVKNTLHEAEESSSGYRQVLVNLTIVTDWTERMGIAMHVAEVQLLLREFATAKTVEGHRRYVDARNGRGE